MLDKSSPLSYIVATIKIAQRAEFSSICYTCQRLKTDSVVNSHLFKKRASAN